MLTCDELLHFVTPRRRDSRTTCVHVSCLVPWAVLGSMAVSMSARVPIMAKPPTKKTNSMLWR
jgi:hypothetical protein